MAYVIPFRVRGDHERGPQVLIVVLTRDNLERMREGDPFDIQLKAYGQQMDLNRSLKGLDIVIAYEEDTQELKRLAALDDLPGILRWIERGRIQSAWRCAAAGLGQRAAMSAPCYWRNETGGQLVPAIERYLTNDELRNGDIPLIRAYLRQWINSSVWDDNPHLDADGLRELADLRSSVETIATREDIDAWLKIAFDKGLDPL